MAVSMVRWLGPLKSCWTRIDSSVVVWRSVGMCCVSPNVPSVGVADTPGFFLSRMSLLQGVGGLRPLETVSVCPLWSFQTRLPIGI